MAGKPIGTMFVELDLDASRYTKGQQQLLKDAQQSSSVLEKNFQNLGIKSAATMDLMRAKIKNSFDAIANNSKATANDIIRAEEAKNAKLKALNDQQFGEQKSLIDNLKKNWLAYSASIYAVFKAVGQAVEIAQAGSMLEKQSQAFENLSAAAKTSSQRVISDLKNISRGMVSEADLMTAAGKAMLMSIPAKDITKLMEIAAATSRMTGQTITEAFADITMGVARQSKMILDNLGIIVNVDKANQDYAKTLGKTADSLSDTEKRQAFMNSTIAAGEEMIKRLGEQKGTLDGVNKALAGQKNAWDEISKSVAHFLDGPLETYGGVLDAIAQKLKAMRASSIESDRDREQDQINSIRKNEGKGFFFPGSPTSAERQLAWNKKYIGESEAELADQAAFQRWYNPDQFAAQSDHAQKWIEFTDDDLKAMAKEREKYLEKVEAQAKKEQERIAQFWADYKPRYSESQRSEAELADEKAMEDYKKFWSGFQQRLPESQRSEAELADEKAMEEWKKKNEKAFSAMTELSEETARAMQSNFSDLFFDAMTGELDSLEDYATAILRSIQRAFADVAGQMATEGLFGAKSVGGTAGGGGLIGSLAGLFGGSGTEQLGQYAKGGVFGRDGDYVRFARGGVVTRPTVFPFARGTGLMGEAGPEAIMPLARNSKGELGIKAGASGGGETKVEVNIHNYSGEQVTQREQQGPGGMRQLDVFIGGLINSGGAASRAIESTYGVRRQGR